ncbi:MAG: hypothetical protein AAGJ40_09065 [Planctomycetota bacterium]
MSVSGPESHRQIRDALEQSKLEMRAALEKAQAEQDSEFREWGLEGHRLPPRGVDDWIHLGLTVEMSREEVLDAPSLEVIRDAAFAWVERQKLLAKMHGKVESRDAINGDLQEAAQGVSLLDTAKFANNFECDEDAKTTATRWSRQSVMKGVRPVGKDAEGQYLYPRADTVRIVAKKLDLNESKKVALNSYLSGCERPTTKK